MNQDNRQVALGGEGAIKPAGLNEVSTASREVATIQGQIIMARRFPRDEVAARARILQSCDRPKLAFGAIYKYARGGSNIEGPSIRLAEELARSWGNIDFGIHELEQLDGESIVEAYAWDLETNTRQTKRFTVPHIRYSKDYGNKVLTDPRDIYETVANNGARRLRACILGIIPSDIVDEATEACIVTQQKHTKVTEESVAAMVKSYQHLGVSEAMIEDRIQRSLSAIDAYLFNDLRNVYASIKDGMGSPADFFNMDAVGAPKAKALGSKAPKAKKGQEEPAEAPVEAVEPVGDLPPADGNGSLFEEGF